MECLPVVRVAEIFPIKNNTNGMMSPIANLKFLRKNFLFFFAKSLEGFVM